jgi:hypothetical protein
VADVGAFQPEGSVRKAALWKTLLGAGGTALVVGAGAVLSRWGLRPGAGAGAVLAVPVVLLCIGLFEITTGVHHRSVEDLWARLPAWLQVILIPVIGLGALGGIAALAVYFGWP